MKFRRRAVGMGFLVDTWPLGHASPLVYRFPLPLFFPAMLHNYQPDKTLTVRIRILRKGGRRNLYIALCVELALEEALDLS